MRQKEDFTLGPRRWRQHFQKVLGHPTGFEVIEAE